MSKLMRMNIFGIRSFGPDEGDVQKIHFQSPLTLIQGQNGCGKTTIIESLKFAITGDLPGGCSKGQGFVYDPKLAKTYETRGQIRLRVSDTKGETVTVTKSVCVTQKQSNKLEFKRLDSAISRGNGSDQISGKCVDIDNEMSLALGVSKPVLNNVIFCHQEDSNWPLDDDKKLKERFDDIFDATKYNKCLENVMKYIKANNENQKLLKLQLSTLKETKKYTEVKQNLLREKEERFRSNKNEILENTATSKPLEMRVEEIDGLELNFNRLHTDSVFKKKELASLKTQQEELLKNIKEFTGTDNELQLKVSSFQEDLNSIQSKIQGLETKKQEIEKTEHRLRFGINEQQKKLGELQTEDRQNAQKITNRNNLLISTSKDVNLKITVNTETTNESVKQTIMDVNTKIETNKTDVVNLEKELDTEERELQSDIDKIRESAAELNQNINSKKKQLAEIKDELRQIKHKLQELNTADDQLKLVESKLNRIEREYNALESSVNTDALKLNIESEKQKSNSLEDRLTIVDSEIQSLQHYASLQTELDLKKENKISKENDLRKLNNKHETTFKHIFPDGVPTSDLKLTIDNYQKTQVKHVRDLNNKINNQQREVMKLETKLTSQRDKLNEKERELEIIRREIAVHCPANNDLESVVKHVQLAMEKLQNDRGVLYSSKYIYQKFIRNLSDDKPACPICKRDVKEKQAVKQIITDLEKKIENVPTQLTIIDEKISVEQVKYEVLLGLKPQSEKMQILLRDEVPQLKIEVSSLDSSLNRATNDLTQMREDIISPQKNEQVANTVMGDAALIDQYQKELNRLQQEIASLSSRIPHNESARGMQEALSEQETLKIDIKSTRNNVESQRSKLTQHTERLQKQKQQQNELTAQKLNIRKNLQDKDHLVTKSIELQEKVASLENELQELQALVQPLDRKLKSAIAAMNEQKRLNRIKLEHVRAKYNNLKRKIDDIRTLQSSIDEFALKRISNKIDLVNVSISKFEHELTQYSDQKSSINNSVDELKVQVTNGKVYFRELEDNVQLRVKRQNVSILEIEIRELIEKLGDCDIQKLRREKDEKLRQIGKLRDQRNKFEGKLNELEDSIKELSTELSLPKHMNANLNYKKKFLELKLHERAVVDLKEFTKAMDWAMMQFHKQRMVQINGIIKQLWRDVYKGNDCDYIEIKTEDMSKSSTDKRKVYNYRVVQIKNEIELDMRGRCSAGQKVLASLIIRMALADTFSSNCGILALDEPTTNLDRENIHSLSEALIDLINQKKQQKNFQLLIITHDQDFVDKLTRVENMDCYHVVRRNEFGKSTISMQYH